ncbi:MAG: helix-turn-helix domain-containing protein [Acidobacteriota bacterium]
MGEVERLPFDDPLVANKDLNGHLRELVDLLIRLGITLKETQAEIERLYIVRTLSACDGNRSKAAKRLGIHRNTLNARLEQYGAERDRRP